MGICHHPRAMALVPARQSLTFQEGKEANTRYLIREGKVALEVVAPGHGSLTIETLGGGDMLGWSWLIPPYRSRFDARAVEMTRAIALDGKCLRAKCEEVSILGLGHPH